MTFPTIFGASSGPFCHVLLKLGPRTFLTLPKIACLSRDRHDKFPVAGMPFRSAMLEFVSIASGLILQSGRVISRNVGLRLLS
jgi:hypothetical protein